jgi:hypothetical protein
MFGVETLDHKNPPFGGWIEKALFPMWGMIGPWRDDIRYQVPYDFMILYIGSIAAMDRIERELL